MSTARKIDWSKWIGSPTAWLALVISAGTFYYNIVRNVNDTRVFTTNELFGATTEAGSLLFSGSFTGTFMNRGTTPIAIMGVKSWIHQLRDDQIDCRSANSFVKFELEPFVLKPGDVAVKDINVIRGALHISLQEENMPRIDVFKGRALICLTFEYATSERQFESDRIPWLTVGPDKPGPELNNSRVGELDRVFKVTK